MLIRALPAGKILKTTSKRIRTSTEQHNFRAGHDRPGKALLGGVASGMSGSVAWKWKAAQSRHETGSSTCKSSPREAFDERWHPPPRNPMEYGKILSYRSLTDA
jgi:hypothetical protein